MNYLKIEVFTKQYDYLICIDSDGTAIDAMNVKHNRCHGPCFISEWGLKDHRDDIQEIWNEINLYNSTRGVNRYIALVEMLDRINGKYGVVIKADELKTLKNWVNSAENLSNKGLEEEIRKDDSPILKKALKWSLAVNQTISRLTADDKKPFPGVKECLEYAYGKADMAVISSSNMGAICEEWDHHDMLKYIGVMTAQEIGTKGECIARMMQKGYDSNHVLMIGDAFPDLDAAKENRVYFFPILTRHEKESWEDLKAVYLDELLAGRYGAHQEVFLKKFTNSFYK